MPHASDPLGILNARYDPFANNNRGGYVEDPLDAAKAALARADALSAETGLDRPRVPKPAPRSKGTLRGITEAMAAPAVPLGALSLASLATGPGAALSIPLGAAGAMFAAPDILRRFVAPEEDEGRIGAGIEGGLSMLPVAGPVLRGIRSFGHGARAVSKAGPSLDDVVRGADMYADAGSRAGGLAARTGEDIATAMPESFKPFATPEALAARKFSRVNAPDDNPMGYTGTFDDGVASLADDAADTVGYSTPGFWEQADRMFEQAKRALPFVEDPSYARIRSNPRAQQALLDAMRDAKGLPRLARGEGILNTPAQIGDDVDLSLATRGGPSEAARRAQDLARRFRSNRPSTEF